MKWPSRAVWASMGLVSLAAVAMAVFSQHRWEMQPCPWCILQRLIFIGIGVLSLIAACLPSRGNTLARLAVRLLAALVALLAVSGAAAALYQNRVAAKSASCDLTLADRIVSGLGVDARWPEVFEVRASCADAAVSLIGVPYELWSLLLFVLLGAVAAHRLLARSP
jgi:protein dithiol:quinone oxidoreductase